MTTPIFRALALSATLVTYVTVAAAGADETPSGLPSQVATLLKQGGQLGKAVFADGNTARGGHGQTVDGIEGSSQEMLKTHVHAHLAIYYKGEQIAVPRGIGILPPLRIANGFVGGGQGYYWLHTHDASGILHVESPNDRVYTLGNFFDVWGQPLTAGNVAGLKGPVRI
ncbi:hypothetical protein RCH06_000560 [Polaromonas sp. CG_9.5]|uniref:hypothetical protein n=1 Tax=Polaromonas sp. CG_9.5 TaxID=3071705 RepID=UPI002E0255B0|nr:hypothetical protein [Polaromonas sp. CG_9.5]